MCNPAMVMAGGVSALKIGTSYMQLQGQNKAAEKSAESANKAAQFKYSRIYDRMVENNEAAAQKKLQRQLQTQRERSKILVAQGEAGVSGNSSLRALGNAIMQGSYDIGVIEANRNSANAQSRAEMEGVYHEAKGRVNEARSKVTKPFMGSLLIGSSDAEGFLTGYRAGKELFPKKKK